MNKPTIDKGKILFIFSFVAIVAIMYVVKFGCVYQRLFGVTCLGCGMTRAVISAIKLDFVSAYSYHKMFWSLPICALYFFCDGKPFKSKFINIAIIVIIGVGFLINWLSHPILV